MRDPSNVVKILRKHNLYSSVNVDAHNYLFLQFSEKHTQILH